MAGVAVEDALELWASSLREVKRRLRPLFSQERVAVSAGLFLDGLFGPERRKTGWMRAEAAGDPGPWRQQAILGRGRWQADGLDHNETRSWHGWHRHVSLVMLAFAMLAVIRHHANTPTPPKIPIRLARRYQTSSAGRSRSSAASPSASPSDASRPMSSLGPSGDAPTRPPHKVHI